jgi:TetR/AcrR family fatty acid metabolism transcriptional regulator
VKTRPESLPPAIVTAGEKSVTRSTDKHERILDAAISVFAESGFFNARVSDIADRAGVAAGTVYLYFRNKEEILMAAINRPFVAFLERARSELVSIGDPRARLRRLAFLHLDALGSNRSLAVVVQMELRQSVRFLSEFSHQQLSAYLDLIREVIREGQQAGLFRRELSEKVAANCFFGALDEMVTSWVLSEREYSLVSYADGVADVILLGMETRSEA